MIYVYCDEMFTRVYRDVLIFVILDIKKIIIFF